MNFQLPFCNCWQVVVIPSPRHTQFRVTHSPRKCEVPACYPSSGSMRSLLRCGCCWTGGCSSFLCAHTHKALQSHTHAWGVGSCVLHPMLMVLQMDAGCYGFQLGGCATGSRQQLQCWGVWLGFTAALVHPKVPFHDHRLSRCFYTSLQGDCSFSQKFLGNLLVTV